MTVALLVEFKDGTLDSAPLSYQDIYRDYWVPLAEGLGRVWFPMFVTGVPIKEHIEEVLAEVPQLRDTLAKGEREIPADIRQYMLERLGLLEDKLREVRNDDRVASIYIG